MSNKLGRRSFLAGSSAIAAAGLFAPSIARAANPKIKIGYMGSLSGSRANFGETEVWNIEKVKGLVKDGVNLKGQQYDVEILVRDSQSEARTSSAIGAELMLRERCNLILAQDVESAVVNGEIADTRGIPMISTMSPLETWFFPRGGVPDKPFPYTFHFFATADGALSAYANMLNQLDTNKIVGTTFLDNPAGQSLMDPNIGWPRVLKANGYTEVPTGLFQFSTNDFSNQVAAFRDGNADILSGFLYANHFVPMWNQVLQSGLRPKAVAMVATFLFPSSIAALQDNGAGMLTEVWWTPAFPFKSSLTGQSSAELAQEWEESAGQQWTQPLGYGHALWEVGLAALGNAEDPLDAESLRDGIASLSVDTIVGKVDFTSGPFPSTARTEVVGGQWNKATEGPYPYKLDIVDNTSSPMIETTATVLPLTYE